MNTNREERPRRTKPDATIDPTKAFDSPKDVVQSPRLTNGEKEKALNTWEADERALQRATEEGMTGGERPRLGEVKRAQLELDEKTS